MTQKLRISAVHVSAKPDTSDPMGDRSYLAVKFDGGIYGPGGEERIEEFRDKIAGQIEVVLRAAVEKPDQTVAVDVAA